MNAITEFSFQESHPIRVVLIDGAPWFVAADVCKAIEISNPSEAIRRLDGDEKNTLSLTEGMRNSAGNPMVNVVNESGLYTLILRCRDAVKQGTTAWRFRKWVTNEVLPAIRKNGVYAYVEPASKRAGEPLHWRHKNELQQLVNDIARTFRYNNAWVAGIWVALRRSCNNPSPNPLTTDDLPAVLHELRRIACAAQHAAGAMSDYEKELLRLVVRRGHSVAVVEGLAAATIQEEEQPVLPAYLERALQHLESMELLLPERNALVER